MKKLLQKYSTDKISTGAILYNRGQHYERSQYAFLQNASDEEDDKNKDIFLPTRNEEFLEKELEPGDTLQTLSIQFNCPIAELKRVNNIHRENEVFARRIIKVPIRYYSLLSEKVAGVHKKRDDVFASTSSQVDNASTSTLASSYLINTLIKTKTESHDITNHVLSRDGDIVIKNSCPLEDDDSSLATSTLVPQTTTHNKNTHVFECNGSDWDLSWLHLLACIFLFLLGGPILYLLYHQVEPKISISLPVVNSNTTASNHKVL